MYRGYNNNTPRGPRPLGNRVIPRARPDSGRGNIVSSERAEEVRRRHDSRQNMGGVRDPQVGRSLADRITIDRGGRGGRARGGRHAHGANRNSGLNQGSEQSRTSSLAERITGGSNSRMNPGDTRVNVSTNATTINRNNEGLSTVSNTQGSALFLSSQQTQGPSEGGTQGPTFSFNSLFDEPTAASAPTARANVNAPVRMPQAPIRMINRPNNPKPARVVKSSTSMFQNKKLRAVFEGRKIRQPKRQPDMLLRMGLASKGVAGYELTCSSPARDNDGDGDNNSKGNGKNNGDDYDADDDADAGPV